MGQLVRALEEMQQLPNPKLLHVITTKGKGFLPAEENQSDWHAHSGGFDTVTGITKKKIALPLHQNIRRYSEKPLWKWP